MFNKFRQAPGQMGQKTKMMGQLFKVQKQLNALETKLEEKGIKVVIKGGGLLSGPKVKQLEIDEGSEANMINVLNKALKKSHKRSMKKLQEVGGSLQGAGQ